MDIVNNRFSKYVCVSVLVLELWTRICLPGKNDEAVGGGCKEHRFCIWTDLALNSRFITF